MKGYHDYEKRLERVRTYLQKDFFYEILGRKCSECGDDRGYRLHIHHKKYEGFPKNRTKDNLTKYCENLMIMCHKCHLRFHKKYSL